MIYGSKEHVSSGFSLREIQGLIPSSCSKTEGKEETSALKDPARLRHGVHG